MKKIILLTFFAFAFGAITHAQLATKVSTSYSYGKLFTDGTNLYEVKLDTLYSVATGTGARTFMYKLPAPPPTYIVKWGINILVKTAAGFMIDQQLQNPASPATATYKVWTNTSGSWDTIATTTTNSGIKPLVKLGSKWAFYIVEPSGTPGSRMVRTDFTKAGTAIVPLPVGTYATDIRQGTDRIFFSMLGNGTTIQSKVVMMDDMDVKVLDSANAGCNTIAALGNDLFYYRDQVTTTTVDYSVKKWTAASGITSVLIPDVPFTTAFKDGATVNGNLIVQKVDSGAAPQRDNLVSININTGVQTYLTANTRNGSAFPIYFLQNSGYGAVHAYIVTRDSNAYVTTITDGATAAGTQKIAGPGILFSGYKTTDPSLAAICADDDYGQPIYTTGISQQLYHIDPSGAISHQDLNAATVGGSLPANFVHVGNDIFFTASQAQGTTGYPNYIYDLWKIAGCLSVSSVTTVPVLTDNAILYPNPATEYFTIKCEADVKNIKLELYNATGNKLINAAVENGQTFSTRSLAPGTYFYRLLSSNGSLLHADRIIITH